MPPEPRTEPWFLEHLVCPVDLEPLRLKENHLYSAAGRRFQMLDSDHRHPGIAMLALPCQNKSPADPPAPPTTTFAPLEEREPHSESDEPAGPPQARVPPPRWPLPEASGDGLRLLLLSCGDGSLAISAARAGHRVIVTDPDPGALRHLRRLLLADLQMAPRVALLCADVRLLPLAPASIDAVFIPDLLTWLPKHVARAALTQVSHAMREGASLHARLYMRPSLSSWRYDNVLGSDGLPPDADRRMAPQFWSVPDIDEIFTGALSGVRVTPDWVLTPLAARPAPLQPAAAEPPKAATRVLHAAARTLASMARRWQWAAHLCDSVILSGAKPAGPRNFLAEAAAWHWRPPALNTRRRNAPMEATAGPTLWTSITEQPAGDPCNGAANGHTTGQSTGRTNGHTSTKTRQPANKTTTNGKPAPEPKPRRKRRSPAEPQAAKATRAKSSTPSAPLPPKSVPPPVIRSRTSPASAARRPSPTA